MAAAAGTFSGVVWNIGNVAAIFGIGGLGYSAAPRTSRSLPRLTLIDWHWRRCVGDGACVQVLCGVLFSADCPLRLWTLGCLCVP